MLVPVRISAPSPVFPRPPPELVLVNVSALKPLDPLVVLMTRVVAPSKTDPDRDAVSVKKFEMVVELAVSPERSSTPPSAPAKDKLSTLGRLAEPTSFRVALPTLIWPEKLGSLEIATVPPLTMKPLVGPPVIVPENTS